MGRCFASRLTAVVRMGSALMGLALVGLAADPVWAACAPAAVELRWTGGQARFSVEIADTEALREYGLMNRDHMATSAGMLFVYASPEHAFYWMKNTLIPLDIIFADQTGRVTVVHPDAVPGDLTPLDGGEGVQYVLEINGGLAMRMGIVPGAELRAAAVDPAKAAWACVD